MNNTLLINEEKQMKRVLQRIEIFDTQYVIYEIFIHSMKYFL